MREEYWGAIKEIGYIYENTLGDIFEKYKILDNLSTLVFSKNYNLVEKLEFSKKLGIARGVPEFKILRSIEDIDDYFAV